MNKNTIKKVAILGFGIEGRDAAKYFSTQDVQVSVFDKKSSEELGVNAWIAQQGEVLHNIKWVLGEGYLDSGLYGFDLIVRSPGARPDLPQILEAADKGAQLTSNTKIFFDECTKPIIAVTGTKGKGTTSTMIAKGLEEIGRKVFLAGNIGEPMLAGIKEANESDYAVLELSSFQTMDLTKSPHVAVITNLTSDHMDWHTSQEEYVKAKFNLWAHQTKNDYIVFNWQNKTLREIIGEKPMSGVTMRFSSVYNPECYVYIKHEKNHEEIWCKGVYVGRPEELKVPGKHNVENAMAAIAAIGCLGEGLEKAWKGITAFEGLEHRLEKVAELNGILYINDSYATNPEPTLAAIRSYEQPKVLILGGSGKGASFTKMAKEISQVNVRGVVLIGDEAEKIEKALNKASFKGEVKKGFTKMIEMVKATSGIAQEGDVVLLTPACASFGLFQNYKDRGKQFKEAVLMLK